MCEWTGPSDIGFLGGGFVRFGVQISGDVLGPTGNLAYFKAGERSPDLRSWNEPGHCRKQRRRFDWLCKGTSKVGRVGSLPTRWNFPAFDEILWVSRKGR